MKNSIRKTISAFLVGSLMVVPALSQDIIVEPKRTTVDTFVENVSNDLDDQLRNVRMNSMSLYGGVAQVRFPTQQSAGREGRG